MCIDFDYHFPSMYAAVGLWNGVFLIIYSLFGFSKLMKWCTRSTEEIFALFIVIAFITDASKELMKSKLSISIEIGAGGIIYLFAMIHVIINLD